MKKVLLFIVLLLIPIAFIIAGIRYSTSWSTQVGLFILFCYVAIGTQFGRADDSDMGL